MVPLPSFLVAFISSWVRSFFSFHPLRSVSQQQQKLHVSRSPPSPSSVSTPHKVLIFHQQGQWADRPLLPTSFEQGHNGGGPLRLPRGGGGTVCLEGKTGPSLCEVDMLFTELFLWESSADIRLYTQHPLCGEISTVSPLPTDAQVKTIFLSIRV